MVARFFAATALVLVLPAMLYAETWTSADGFLTVTIPNADGFEKIPDVPEPMAAAWGAKDETVNLVVIRIVAQPGEDLSNQRLFEKGFEDETGAKVTRMPPKTISGHEVWNMKATSPDGDFTQAVIRKDGVMYTVMAVTMGENADQTLAQKFIDSISLAQADTAAAAVPGPSAGPRSSAAPNATASGEGVSAYQLGRYVGTGVLVIVIGVSALLIATGKMRLW